MAPALRQLRSGAPVSAPGSLRPLLLTGALWAASSVVAESQALFGPKNVLYKYSDRNCTKAITGQGGTQSWTRVVGAESCYEVTQGLHCVYRCIFKLTCEYNSGTGVVIHEMDDTSCSEPASGVIPLQQNGYWSQANSLFKGGCVADGSGAYVKFAQPLDPDHAPDCSSYGEVEPGETGGAAVYDATYTMQFYQDVNCKEEYNVTTYGDRPTSRFDFKLFRGAQYCYDMVDVTPRSESVASRDIGYSKLNFRLVCGNLDGVGNGILIQDYDGPKCTGTPMQPKTWADVFYPMNYPNTMGLLTGGKCTRWGQFRVKMLKPFDIAHIPECKTSSCTEGACSGGRVSDPSNSGAGTIYMAEIRSSGGDPAAPRSTTTSAASMARVASDIVLSAVILRALSAFL